MTQNIILNVTLTSKIRLQKALQEAGVENPAMVTKLTVSGMLANSDFSYIRKKMGKTLRILDMGNASVRKNTINERSFVCCSGLTSIIIPPSVTKISNTAFRDCPATVTIHPDNPAYTNQPAETWFFTKPYGCAKFDNIGETRNVYRKGSKQSRLVLYETAKYQDGIFVEQFNHRHYPQKLINQYFERFENVKYDEHKKYNKAGRLIELDFLRNREFVSGYSFDYDRKGNEIRSQFFQIAEDLQCDFYSKYDKNNRKIEMKNWAINVPQSTVFYEYDDVNQFSKIVSRQLSDYPECSVSFVYDGDKLLEEQYSDRNGKMFLTVQYVYNSANCLIEKSIIDKGMLFYKVVTQYDKKKRKKSAQSFINEDYRRYEYAWFSGIADFMM